MDSTAPLRRRYAVRHVAARAGVYFAAIVAALVCAGPFPWSLATAFKQNRDLYDPQNNPFVFNQPATWDHVNYLFTDTAFPIFVWNTVWVGGLVVLITLVLTLPAAYALAGSTGRGRDRWASPSCRCTWAAAPAFPCAVPEWSSRWGCRTPPVPLVLAYPTTTIPVGF
jgi:multiple sugar transport system permease protein